MNPFAFNRRVRAVIISYKSSKQFKNLLNDLKIDYIETIKCKDLDLPVDDHPDMVIHPVNYSTFVVYNEHFDYYLDKTKKYNINIIKSKEKLNPKYPKDILLNISRLNNYYFYKKDFIDENLQYLLDKENTGITVNQGYAKCSSMIIKENTVITTDLKLHKIFLNLGLKSYLLNPNFIDLSGYNTGFIGGTCGNIGKDEVIFYGNLKKYKYYEELRKILEREKIDYYYPNVDTFIDRGSIIGILGG
ncbi:DUF6873 family GME fold protein [Miniphocaeibacter halophilus]|uniref:Uncharacterized protein n=1 Tax=Miniphocaeibacter halophilus TaxID=2931922 RepID=A0AC61MQ73_9FIRM|nr:hypothetical protein [Miniphocaeibacter halophilus]QQK07719.1 hypothetical protein JFY71_10570 [Miniphocaeibacter halophilus]